jgi:alkylation response protein AidB-like acyl-CoA dehydrogenase
MERTLYEPDHEAYRQVVREFFEREVVPHLEQWDDDHLIDRSIFPIAAKQGIFGLEIPEEYGGSGVRDYRYRLIVSEEAERAHATALNVTLGLIDDLVLSYFLELATPEQSQRWLPGIASGELLGALAMTEPGAGSDLRGIRTTARPDGDGWLLTGSKTFITSGISADLVIVAARDEEIPGKLSLFVVERDMPGFTRGRKLKKVGLQSQDTAELFFDDVRIPAENLLGTRGKGLNHLMSNLARERLGIVATAYATARAVYEVTRTYCFERTAFGGPIGDLQTIRFTLAEIETELDVAEAYVDASVRAFNAGTLSAVDASKGKWYISELAKRVVDRCVQLHGGYGYMLEYPVARAYTDVRIQTIYGGTTEIMKEIVGRDIAARSGS